MAIDVDKRPVVGELIIAGTAEASALRASGDF